MLIPPFDFVRSHVSLTWSEVALGLQNGWLNLDDAVSLAMDQVEREDAPSHDTVELAAILPSELARVPELVSRLAVPGGEPCKEKWLYLFLAWLYEHRTTTEDPFQAVEVIYATFDYPEQIEAFVRYLPAQVSRTTGEARMLEAWASYLRCAEQRFRKITQPGAVGAVKP